MDISLSTVESQNNNLDHVLKDSALCSLPTLFRLT